MLRVSKKSKCPYFESTVSEILDKLLEKGVIELLETKRPEQIGRTIDPKYYKFHMIISHPIEKCWTFKEQVM